MKKTVQRTVKIMKSKVNRIIYVCQELSREREGMRNQGRWAGKEWVPLTSLGKKELTRCQNLVCKLNEWDGYEERKNELFIIYFREILEK